MLLIASLCAAAGPEPVGVTLRFPSGGALEGVLVSESSGAVRIESDGGLVEFARGELADLLFAPNAHSEFKRRAAAVPVGDAAALWELSRWALENGLPGWGRACAAEVLRLRPDHAQARVLLAAEPETRELDGPWERWVPPPPRPARMRPAAAPAPARTVYYFMGSGALRLPPSRLELPAGFSSSGPGLWRPEPFQAGSATLGLPPPEPVGSRIGYDPMR